MKLNGNLTFKVLGSGEVQNAIIERVAGGAAGGSLPGGAGAEDGRILFNTDSQTYWYYAGAPTNAWVEFSIGSDLSKIITSTGYMNSDGTFNASAFVGFTNINSTGSPFATLVDALSQLDVSISNRVLDSLVDVNITGPSAGDILVYGVGSGSPISWKNEQPGANTGVQPYDVGLASIASLSLDTNDFIYVSQGSPETFNTLASGTTGRALLGDETVANAITTLGLNSGGASDIWVDITGDIMSGTLDMSGNASARILLNDGSIALPSLGFASVPDSGMYINATGLRFSFGNSLKFSITSTSVSTGTSIRYLSGTLGTEAAPAYATSDNDSGMFSVEDGILGFSAQGVERLRIYGKDYDLITGSPNVESATGAISVEATANYESLIGDPAGSGYLTPVDDFVPNAQWVDLYYLRKSGGTMSGILVMNGNNINMSGGNITNVGTPADALDATNKNYVDNLVSSGTVWVNPIVNPDLVGISADEVLNPLSSGMYIAYGGVYPQYWSVDAGSPAGSPATSSPQFIEVNEYDLMHFTFGEWQKSGTLQNGTRLLAGVFTNAIDTTPGQNLSGTGIQENDYVEYIGDFAGSPNNPFDPANWNYPHGRVGGVVFEVLTVTASTKTFIVVGDQTLSFHENNTMLYSGGGSPAGSGSPSSAGTYTIDSVTFLGSPNQTVIVVDEVIPNDDIGGTLEPEMRNGTTTLTSNSNDSHFGQSYLYVASSNEWVQISGPGSIDPGIGLSYSGNTLNVNLGAGIFEQPGDEVGIELYNSASGGLILTTDGTNRSTSSSTKLHLKLAASGGLDQGVTGLFVASGGITNTMLDNDSWTITDGTNNESVELGNTLTVTGSIVTTAGVGSPAQGILKFRRIEDADGDTYVQVSTGVADDSDTVSIVAAGGGSGTFDSTGVTLSGAAIDIDAITTTVAINSTTALTLTGGADATLSATTLDALIQAVAGSVELDASTAVEVLSNTELRLMDADNTNYIGHKSAAVVSLDVTYQWPEAPSSSGYVLTSATSGIMTWISPTAIGRTRLEDLDDVVVNIGSPGEQYVGGQVIVATGTSPNIFESKAIQYIYDSTLTTATGGSPLGSPIGSPLPTIKKIHVINHNIGQKYVSVTVYNSSNQEIIPENVTPNSVNQITVTFDIAIDCIVVIMGVPGIVPANGS